jgi:uncharacterized protein YndB with AHSA1/START domain
VRITRVLAAPRDLVFDVHTKPEYLPKWMLGPPGWTMPVCEIACAPAAPSATSWCAADRSELVIAGTFHEIVRPHRLWPETCSTSPSPTRTATPGCSRRSRPAPAARLTEKIQPVQNSSGLPVRFHREEPLPSLSMS